MSISFILENQSRLFPPAESPICSKKKGQSHLRTADTIQKVFRLAQVSVKNISFKVMFREKVIVFVN